MQAQYCALADGSRVAFERAGRGYVTICLSASPFGGLTSDARYSQWPAIWRRIGLGRSVVRFDSRGTGLSDDMPECSDLVSRVDEVSAIVDATGAEQVALIAPVMSGPVGVAFAARYPERVSHLVLPFTFAGGTEFSTLPRLRALQRISRDDPALYLKAVSSEIFDWTESEDSNGLAEALRERVGVEQFLKFQHEAATLDARELLCQVQAPTLVVHRRGMRIPTEALARTLAREIPNARLALLEGGSIMPLVGDSDSVVAAIDEFLPRDGRTNGRAAPAEELTSREAQTLTLVAAGLRNSEIAEELSIAPATVKRHLYKAYRKLGARSRTEAAVIAREISALG